MSNAKIDIFGATYNFDVQDVFKSTATRPFTVKNLPDDNRANAEAVQVAIDEVGGVYQAGVSIPLKRVRVIRDAVMGPNAVRGVLEYGFTQSSGQQQAARLLATLSAGTIGLPWYRHTDEWTSNDKTGQPDGYVYLKNGVRLIAIGGGVQSIDNPPVPFVWNTKAYTLRVPGQGKSSPYPSADPAFGMANSDEVSFGGLDFIPNQLLSSGLEIAEYITTGGNTYTWDYVFTYLPVTFQKQEVYWTGQWNLAGGDKNVNLHNLTTFSGKFPPST